MSLITRDITVNIDCETTHTVYDDGVRVAAVADDIHITLKASNLSGRGITIMQTSSTDDRIRKELWGDLGEAAPARVGISNITIINPQINQPAGEAILAQGEPTLPIKGVQISGGKVGNVPPGKQPIKLAGRGSSS